MSSKIFYVDHCPVCEQGLVRIRLGRTGPQLAPVFLCDECDAAWFDPELKVRIRNQSADISKQKDAPIENREEESGVRRAAFDFWGENTHWATAPEIALLGFHRFVKLTRKSDET